MTNRREPLPPLDKILDDSEISGDKTKVGAQAQLIEQNLAALGFEVSVRDVRQGPTLTQFSLKPGPEVKISQIKKLDKDLALGLSGLPVYIEDPTPNYPYLRLIIPNQQTIAVKLRRVLESPVFQQKEGVLKVGLGVDTFDQPVVIDLAGLPHLLIGGTTGSGKSVCLNGMIANILCTYPPQMVRLVLIDPLQVELKHYEGIPHLLVPVTTKAEQVLNVLASLNTEITRRFSHFSKRGVREIKAYNQQATALNQEQMPYIVIFIDNLTDLMLDNPREMEQSLSRIAAMGRGAGVHLIFATQRSNVDVVSGALKANASGRIAFHVVDSADSRLILDAAGAEDLLGPGDMLYKTPDTPFPRRAQGVYVSETELGRIIKFWQGR